MDFSAMQEQIVAWLIFARDWLFAEVLNMQSLPQLAVVIASLLLARYAASWGQRALQWLEDAPALDPYRRGLKPVIRAISDIMMTLIWLILQGIAGFAFEAAGYQTRILTVTTSLLTAWIVIRLATQFVRNPAVAHFVTVAAWSVAALNILGLLEIVREYLRSVSFKLGAIDITFLDVVESVITFIIVFWLALLLARLIDQRVRASPDLTPSVKVLIGKLTRFALIAFAIVVALSGAGIDLTALTVFGGAVGIGVGFGLQKIISNFVSGIILLLDKSVKPGDNIVVGDTFGWIDRLNARYVSVITRDGTEHLIPNEELITTRVENWSFSNRNLRLRIRVGVSYHAQLRKAMELCIEAANETERILKFPKPNCLLRGFGDSAVELEMRVWVDDPEAGRGNVQSELLLLVWDKFHEHGIEIPFPQRDIHIRSVDEDARAVLSSGPPQTS